MVPRQTSQCEWRSIILVPFLDKCKKCGYGNNFPYRALKKSKNGDRKIDSRNIKKNILDKTAPIGKIRLLRKIAVTFEALMSFKFNLLTYSIS